MALPLTLTRILCSSHNSSIICKFFYIVFIGSVRILISLLARRSLESNKKLPVIYLLLIIKCLKKLDNILIMALPDVI